MKKCVILLTAVAVLSACKPKKPWSPYDESGVPNEWDKNSQADSFTRNEQVRADIGDVEAQVYVQGELMAVSKTPNITVNDSEDIHGNILVSNITVSGDRPENLWINYRIKCGRNFEGAPALIRAQVLVDDKVAGSFATVLGSKAMRNGVNAKVDLLRPFNGQVPDSFLAKVKGDLFLFPDGTDENTLNPETAESDQRSQALAATIVRVNFVKPGEGGSQPADSQPVASEQPVQPSPAVGAAAE